MAIEEGMKSSDLANGRGRGAPRQDATALGFGVGFVMLGVLGLLHSVGVGVRAAWASAPILIGLGAAGIYKLIRHTRSTR